MELRPYKHKAQYYETDSMKIVHHSNYIRWMEEARVDFLEQINLGYDTMESAGIISPVLSVECEYKSMTRFSETVVIAVRLAKYTGVRFDVEYEMRDEASGTLRAKGRTSHCFLDQNGRPISLQRRNPAWDEILRRAVFTP